MGRKNATRERQTGCQRGLPGWRVASLSSEPPQCEWATRARPPTLPPPRLAACKGNIGRARVKGRVTDRAEHKPQPQDQGETRMDKRDERKVEKEVGRRKRGMRRRRSISGTNVGGG